VSAPLPGGWREHPTGAVVCPHRDVSCCPGCARRPEVVEVLGHHFWVPDPLERESIGIALEQARRDAQDRRLRDALLSETSAKQWLGSDSQKMIAGAR